MSTTAGRRLVVAAASSGIVLTLTASASVAGGAAAPQIAPVQTANLTASIAADTDPDSLTVAPTVTTAADASFSFDGADVTSEPPPPPPPPPPPVVVAPERPVYAAASRDVEREALVETETEVAPVEEAPVEVAPAASASGSAIVDIARRYIGTPYVSGGAAPGGFDCSGFTMYVFAQLGISLPRTSGDQRYAGTVVSAAEAQPGDLVWGPGHVGIYTGNGQHIAARNPSTALYESPIYLSNPVFIRVG